MGCGETLVKYILFITNLVFTLAGLVLIGLGVTTLLQVSGIPNEVTEHFETTPILTITVGCFIFVISFFGCCGAIRESNCMLITYTILMMVLMGLKIAFSTYIFIKLPDLDKATSQLLQPVFKNNLETFHELERTWRCCGTTGLESYKEISRPVPPSCCFQIEGDNNVKTGDDGKEIAIFNANQNTPCNSQNAYQGCDQILTDYLKTMGVTLASIVLVVASAELVAIVFGCCLANHVRNKNRRTRY